MTESPQGIGLAAFETLQAEVEPWLDRCFVPPPHFDAIRGPGSFLVVGGRGSGKTALCEMLLRLSSSSSASIRWLGVRWQPTLLYVEETSRDKAVESVFQACATALLERLSADPLAFLHIVPSAQDFLLWFLRRYGEWKLARWLAGRGEPSGRAETLLKEALSRPPPRIFAESPDPVRVIRLLISALNEMEMWGVHIVVDASGVDLQQALYLLSPLLDDKAFFRNKRFAFKLVIPEGKEALPLRKGRAVSDGLLDTRWLTWDIGRLREIVTRRLACAVGEEALTLARLYRKPESLLRWLERVGGTSPREWLNQIRPLVAHYLGQEEKHPVDESTWKRLRRQHPPRFSVDERRGRVIVGEREISREDFHPRDYRMLMYLYQHRNRIVSRKELYYIGYLKMEKIPSQREPGYNKKYRSAVDNAIWGLRRKIEPDPDDPLFLETVRGCGVILRIHP